MPNRKLIPVNQTPVEPIDIVRYNSSFIDETIEKWLKDKADIDDDPTASKRTYTAYLATIKDFCDFVSERAATIGVFDLEILDHRWQFLKEAVQAFLGYSKESRVVSVSTRNQRRAILSSFYTYTNVMGIYPLNPARMTKHSRGEKKHAAMPLDNQGIEHGFSQIDYSSLPGKRDAALLALALTTGRRASEIANLTWGDIRKEDGQIVAHFLCKGNKAEKNSLAGETIALLEDYRSHLAQALQQRKKPLDDTSAVFVSFSDRNYGSKLTIQAIGRIAKEILGESRFHATRHTFAIDLDKQGVPLREISEMLGHSDMKTTSDYLKDKKTVLPVHAANLEKRFGIKARQKED